MIKSKTISKILAVVLCAMMLMSVIPMSVFAEIENYNKDYQSATHTVFKHTEQTLAPGVTNYTNYAYANDGKQMVYYVTTADLTRDDVVAQVAYKDMQNDVYGMDKLSNMVACANKKYSDPTNPQFISEYYTVVSACNGDGYNMTTGEPSGVFIMGGNVKKDWNKSSNPAFLAILNDGTAVIDNTQEAWNACKEAGIQEAIDVFGSTLVWDGQDVTANASGSYATDRHSRTMVGITADGKLVICVLDGRQEPFSCGGTMHELAQIMLEAGCWRAFNLDGGGSTTFMAKNEGSNICTVQNRPSDGSERSISNGIIIASTAVPSDTFDHVMYALENDYLVPNASVAINASGVSSAGTSAEMPEDITYTATYGTIENGCYVAGDVAGEDTITAYHNGNAVGSVTINVVIPDAISIAGNALSCPYGKVADIGVTLTKNDKNNIPHDVTFLPTNIEYSISDASFGTVDVAKMTFSATTETLAVTEGTITASLVGYPSVSVTVPLQVGKGTETLFDWEDGKLGKFDCFDYYNSGVQYSLDLVDKTTGKVHSGNYAMEFALDFSQVTYYEDYMDVMVQYNSDAIRAHGDTTDADGAKIAGTLDDYIDITGACGIGFWVYIPDGIDVNGIDPRFFFGYKKSAADTEWTRGASPMVLWVQDREFPTDNWYYYYADLSAFSSYYAMTLQNSRPLSKNGTTKNGQKGYPYDYSAGAMFEFYVNDRAWKTFGVQSYNSNFTLYIDDFMVDYSSVIPDRVAPEFSNVTYAYTGMSDAASLVDGTVIAGNCIDFGVSVTDPTTFKITKGVKTWNTKPTPASGIDASSAKIFIDGNEVASTYKNGKLTLDNAIILADGTHIAKFHIADNQGNLQTLTRTFIVSSGDAYETISVVPHDASLTSTLCGSLYYIDVNATDISKIQSVTTTLKVNNVNNWELKGINVAEGFTVNTSTEIGDAGEVTFTITRTGDVTATGANTLISIPVRAWYPHNALGWNSSTLITKSRVYSMDIQLITKAGTVEYVDGYTQDCIGAFSSPVIQINNESQTPAGKIGIVSPSGTTSWHEHAAAAIDDKAATCTEAGYTGRTYCEVCNSVVDWGATVPATGHTYDFVDGILQCTCGEKFTGTWTDGKDYVDGVVAANGWKGESYYVDGVKLIGLQEIDGYYYDFGNDGICEGRAKLDGFYYDEAVGKYMYFTAGLKITGEVTAYPTVYFFGEDGYAISGEVEIWGYNCTFNEKGAFVSATDVNVIDAGFSGTNLYYVLLSDGTLKVGGEGVMKDYTANGIYPAWIIKNEPQAVTSLVIGNGITHIGRFGFYRNQYLKSVSFEAGSTLESIGWGAFGHCWRLETVTIPASVEVLEGYAFYECGAMKSFTFEEGSRLHTIENCVFQSHHVLKTLVIPDSVTTMGPDIFYRANFDLVLNVVENSPAHSYAIKYGLKYETREGYVAPIYSGEYNDSIKWDIYPSGQLVISGTGTMPNHTNYTQQPWRAYAHMITGITISKDITSIGNYAFAYTCKNALTIKFEEGSQLQSVGVLAFVNCVGVESINLPDTVTYIGAYAFCDCYALENVRVSQAASYIATTAFFGSTNVVLNVAESTYSENFAKANGISHTTRAYVPVTVASGTFDNLTWELYDNGTLKIAGEGAMTNLANYNLYPWYAVSHKVTKIVIGKDVTSIGNYAFAYGFKNVESIVFESGSVLDRIGVVAFMNVANIKDIVLPDSVTYIGAYAFGDCYALETLAVSQMATYIAPTAFAGSKKVVLNVTEGTYAETFAINHGLSYTVREYVVLPIAGGTCGANATWTLYNDGTLAIDGSGDMDSFQDCKLYPWFDYAHKITKITIGKDITKIGNYAFAYYYQNLEAVEFEAGSCLTFVGAVSFMNCAKLQTVILPESVTYIGVYAFADCYALENVYVPAAVTFIGNTAFTGSSNVTVSVASGSYAETIVKNNGVNHVVR